LTEALISQALRGDFKAGLENLVAGVIISILLFSGAALLVGFALKGLIESGGSLPLTRQKGDPGWCWLSITLAHLFGGGLCVGAYFLLGYVRSLVTFRVRVGSVGIAVFENKVWTFFPWDTIVEVNEDRVHEKPPILKGAGKLLMPTLVSKSYLVVAKDIGIFQFDGDKIKGQGKLAKMIKEETDKRNVPWVVEDIHPD
jgi:hypothetical protein